MVDERCGPEGTRGVLASGPRRKRQSYKTQGETFEAVADRLSACYAARMRCQKEIGREAEPVSPSRALVTMEGGNALNRAYECCQTYHTTPGPRATTGMHARES